MSDTKPYSVVVRCDATKPPHRKKGVVVASFDYDELKNSWFERFTKGGYRIAWSKKDLNGVPTHSEAIDANNKLVNYDRFTLGDGGSREYARGIRWVYELVCPVCSPARTPQERGYGTAKGSSLPIREEVLGQILNGFRQIGKHTTTLTELRDIIQEGAKRH